MNSNLSQLQELIRENPDTAYEYLCEIKTKPLLTKIDDLVEQFNKIGDGWTITIDYLSYDRVWFWINDDESSLSVWFGGKKICVRVYSDIGDSNDFMCSLSDLKQYIRERILISHVESFQARLKIIMRLLKTAWKVWFGWY